MGGVLSKPRSHIFRKKLEGVHFIHQFQATKNCY